jgi:hypothetical protein
LKLKVKEKVKVKEKEKKISVHFYFHRYYYFTDYIHAVQVELNNPLKLESDALVPELGKSEFFKSQVKSSQ